jgi:N-acetylglucosamine kinase-like BadF-type ATPase
MDLRTRPIERMGNFILGVDGGGQTTQAVIATEDGEMLGRGLAPACNHHRAGIDAARQAIRTAIDGAFAQVVTQQRGLSVRTVSWTDPGVIGAAAFGLSGVDGPKDESLFSTWLSGLGCSFPVAIGNDSQLVLGGGTPEGWGVALIAGAGSVCVGQDASGRTARVGGWGHVMGDEGSAYEIATRGLRLATQAADGRGGAHMLLTAALHHFRLQEPSELIPVIYRPETTIEDIAGFAVRVLDLAGRRDAHACAVVEQAAAALAQHIETVIRTLGLERPPLALGGLLMRASFKKTILDHLAVPIGSATIVADPLRGAVAIARRLRTAVAA